jgi:transposase InsO family protein
VQKISEQFLIPALEQILEAFPFNLLGFHSDNGSEYINKRVAALLEKLRVEFTKSRSRHSNESLPHEVLWVQCFGRKVRMDR